MFIRPKKVFGASEHLAKNPMFWPKTKKSSGQTPNRVLSHKQQIIKNITFEKQIFLRTVLSVVLMLFFMSRFVCFCIIKH